MTTLCKDTQSIVTNDVATIQALSEKGWSVKNEPPPFDPSRQEAQWDGKEWSVKNLSSEVVESRKRKVWSVGQFLERFPLKLRIAILQSAREDDTLQVIKEDVLAGGVVANNGEKPLLYMNYLLKKKIITKEQYDTILEK